MAAPITMNVLGIHELADAVVCAAGPIREQARAICKLRATCRQLYAQYRTTVTHHCTRSSNCNFGRCYYVAAAGPFSVQTTTTREHRLYAHSRVCRVDCDGGADSVFVWEYPRAHEIRLSRPDFAAIVRLFGLNAAATNHFYSQPAAAHAIICDNYIVVGKGHQMFKMVKCADSRPVVTTTHAGLAMSLYYYAGVIYHIDYWYANTSNVRRLIPFKCTDFCGQKTGLTARPRGRRLRPRRSPCLSRRC